ncbi:MAG: HAMP domain-containing histidine kinase [Bacteroidaceae bacterium]|nr:HAMP domain-containing histidine kinase [Bacteroidaceae bacterium]
MKGIKNFGMVRSWLIAIAIVIALLSLMVSHSLVQDLSREEHGKMELFAEAYRALNDADENTDMGLVLAVISGNSTIPVIVLDDSGGIENSLNIEIPHDEDSLEYLKRRASQMRTKGNSILIYHDKSQMGRYTEVCFDESLLLNRLTWYPYIQLGVVLLFVLIAIFALLSFKKTEQNRVWVGLSKETAHQLGTPISSLMAWTELLRDRYNDDEMILEMDKDVKRLEMIADRFSKIGSLPEPVLEDVGSVLDRVVTYMEHRSPRTVRFVRKYETDAVKARLSASLFEWVIENLCKNAIDAMEGKGTITINLYSDWDMVYIEVSDTGKGISKNSFKRVFQPGFTTKKRGWGLGLSLAKRIVEEYHNGRIFVKSSELGEGTTFRIEIKK